MKPKTTLLVILLAGSILRLLPGQTQNLTIDRGIMGLSQALERLPYVSRVLFVAAHPDDENSGVLPYVSRGLHAETALLTLTRGEGGQNLIGPDLFDALGLIRTGELLVAGEYYGVRQFFTRAFDFGFSKSPDETLQKWGKQNVLSDMVRAIRKFRPHVIVSVWRGSASDGHGHHQASGLLAREAFQAAGDPGRFPELVQEGLTPWSVQKFYVRSSEDPKKQKEGLKGPVVTVDPGRHVPLLGASFQEIASLGYSFHRSQGMGGSYSAPGSRVFSYELVLPAGAASDAGFLDKLEIRLTDLPGLLPAGAHRSWLENEIRSLDSSIAKARDGLRPADFSGTVEPLLAGLARLREISRELTEGYAATSTPDILLFFLNEKEQDFQKALELATGIYFEALSADADVVPGQTFQVSATVVNRSSETIDVQRIELTSEESWKCVLSEGSLKSLGAQEKLTHKYQITVPSTASVSRPHWSRNSKRETIYTITDNRRIIEPLIAPKLSARLDYRIRDAQLSLQRPVEYLDMDRLKGTRKIPLMVVPPLAIDVSPAQQLVSTALASHQREVQVKLVNNSSVAVSGKLALSAPAGWSVEPKEFSFTMGKEGEASSYRFHAQAGKGLLPGRASFAATADLDGRRLEESYRMYSVLGLWRFPLYQKAASEVVSFDYKLPAKLNVGYIMGAGDRVPDTLSALGISVRLLEADELASGDLQQYGCIIAGVRAYDVREDLVAHNARLLDYVNKGGLFIVQYHRQATWNKTQYAPYPAKIKSEEHRVTDETAPVKILDPTHPAFNFPNKITERDFDNWVQERGLYFIQERDPRYQALLSCSDPGQPALDGGLLIADYGQGRYVLTSYAWFRQLPEGVPGAIRIFINLISLKKAKS